MHQKWRPGFARTRRGSLQRSPDLAGFKSGGRDKGRGKREKTGGDRQLKEGVRGRREGVDAEKGRKRVGGEWKQKPRSGVQRHSRRCKMRHRNPQREDKNEVG